jgi:AcrR family transcriptional regulator
VTSSPLVRAPQQARSRRSFDRALDAAVALLVERGNASFTIVEVARKAGVSTGSIYGRVASKDDLLRVAHAREMARISEETTAAFQTGPDSADVSEYVWYAVHTLAVLLQRNSPVLSPFMLLAIDDDVIAAEGKAAYREMTSQFEHVLVAAFPERDLRRHRPVRWSCAVAYSVLARQLALGSDPGAAADFNLEEVVAELSRMITAYLNTA